VVTLDNTAILVTNLGHSLSAIEDVCTHDYCPLSGGAIDGNVIVCPRHGARFDLMTGEALSAPAYEPVTVFPVRVLEGRVQVRDHRFD
jgi:3-phenylpropionate/trans-cinnamate dioxygenase ferredoxin subunit